MLLVARCSSINTTGCARVRNNFGHLAQIKSDARGQRTAWYTIEIDVNFGTRDESDVQASVVFQGRYYTRACLSNGYSC